MLMISYLVAPSLCSQRKSFPTLASSFCLVSTRVLLMDAENLSKISNR